MFVFAFLQDFNYQYLYGMFILLLDFQSLPCPCLIPDIINDLVAAQSSCDHWQPSLPGYQVVAGIWDLAIQLLEPKELNQKSMDLSALLGIVNNSLPIFPNLSLECMECDQFYTSGCILHRSLVSSSSQTMCAFCLSRFFPWHRITGNFASSLPTQDNWIYTCH